jgi:hypothetical protein
VPRGLGSSRLGRALPTILVTALLAWAVAAFVVAERLKLQPPPIRRVAVDRVFSPVCACESRVARIAFVLPRPNRVSLTILDRESQAVRHLVRNRRLRSGPVQMNWDGRTDDGTLSTDRGSICPTRAGGS